MVHRGPLAVDAGHLSVGGRRILRLAELEKGEVIPRRRRPCVRLTRGGAEFVDVFVASLEDARALLSVLGLDVSRKAMTFYVVSAGFRMRERIGIGAGLLIGVGAAIALLLPIGPIVLAMLVTAILLVQAPTRVDVGADGVSWRWLGFRRFVPFARIAHVVVTRAGVHVRMLDGRTVLLRTARAGARKDQGVDTRDRLAERLVEALARKGTRSNVPETEDESAALAVAKRGRASAEWLGALRRAGAADGGAYRALPVARTALWRLVEDPGVRASERAAAAAALAPGFDASERARIRVIAEASVSPHLRVALESADADDERLAPLLDALATEEAAEADPIGTDADAVANGDQGAP
jgi:hypothetical protein